MRVAIYAGSFDPITLGHQDIVLRAAKLFDRVVVAIGTNPAKRYLFDFAERERLIREAVAGAGNVDVVAFQGLLVNKAREVGATVILRGLRTVSDFESELKYATANRDLSGIESMFLGSSPAFAHVSSSLVKEISSNGGDASIYVPPAVASALRRVYGGGA